MFDKRNFLLCALIQFTLIGASIGEKSKFDRHKSSFSVEDVINSVEQFHEKLKYQDKSSKVVLDSEKCSEQLGVFTDALDARVDWAIRSKLFWVPKWFMYESITFSSFSCEVFDAWAKIQSGFDSGNNVNFGSFDQCLSIQHRVGTETIQGQHCMIFYGPNATAITPRPPDASIDWRDMWEIELRINDTTLCKRFPSNKFQLIESFFLTFNVDSRARFLRNRNINRVGSGICVPAVCSPTQVRQYAIKLLARADLEIRPYNADAYCHTNNPLPLTPLDIFAM